MFPCYGMLLLLFATSGTVFYYHNYFLINFLIQRILLVTTLINGGCQCSLVGIVTVLQDDWTGVRISLEVKYFSLLQNVKPSTAPLPPPGLLSSVFPGKDFTSHLHLMPSLRMSGAVSLFPLYALMAWKGKTLSFSPL